MHPRGVSANGGITFADSQDRNAQTQRVASLNASQKLLDNIEERRRRRLANQAENPQGPSSVSSSKPFTNTYNSTRPRHHQHQHPHPPTSLAMTSTRSESAVSGNFPATGNQVQRTNLTKTTVNTSTSNNDSISRHQV